MMTDTTSDLLTRMRNALLMKHQQVTIPYSRFKESILKILQEEGYIDHFEVLGKEVRKMLVVDLKYDGEGNPTMTNLCRVSKPSRRIYQAYSDLKKVRHGLGLRILTTSKGVMSDHQARKQKVGGEILIEVW